MALFQSRAQDSFKGLFRPNRPNPENDQQENTRSSDPGRTPLDYDTPMMDLYKKSLEGMPEEGNYKSGKMQKILAGIAGFTTGDANSAYKTTKGILSEPYQNDLARWKNKIGVTGELAGLEEKGLANRSKNYIDMRKLGNEEGNNESLANYRKIQGRNLEDEMAVRGRTTVSDKSGGTTSQLDRNGKPIWSTRSDETPDEKDVRHLNLFTKENKVTNTGALSRHKDERIFDNAHLAPDYKIFDNEFNGTSTSVNVNDPEAVARLGQTKETVSEKDARARGMKEFEKELGGTNPSQQNAALTGAIERAILDHPSYQKFKDTNGNLKPDENDADWAGFREKIANNLNSTLKKSVMYTGNPLAAKGTTPKIKEVTDEDAKVELTKRGKTITPESIAMAKELLKDQ